MYIAQLARPLSHQSFRRLYSKTKVAFNLCALDIYRGLPLGLFRMPFDDERSCVMDTQLADGAKRATQIILHRVF